MFFFNIKKNSSSVMDSPFNQNITFSDLKVLGFSSHLATVNYIGMIYILDSDFVWRIQSILSRR